MDDHLSSSIKKRRRPALACTQCRRRKMRCDQNSPCNNCARSRRYECVYPADIQAGGSLPRTPSNHSLGTGRSEEQTARRLQTTASDDRAIQARADQDTRFGNGRDSGIGTSSSSGKDIDALPVEVQSLQARVNELENKLALALKSQTHERAAQSASTLNVKQRQRGEHRFANQSSWLNDTVLQTRILRCLGKAQQDHAELRHILTQSKKLAWAINERLVPVEDPATPLIIGSRMPLKTTADRLLQAYFVHYENIFRIIQYSSFVSEYERYWQEPSGASEVFILQLQVCLALAIVASEKILQYGSAPLQWLNEARTWIERSSGGPRKRAPTIKELQLHALLCLAEASLSMSERACWVDVGTLIRKAMGFGLHRDPDHLGIVDPDERKMRRRLWTSIVELNLMLSLQAAQPCAISPSDWDCTIPAEEAEGESYNGTARRRSGYGPTEMREFNLQALMSVSLPLRCRFASRINSPSQNMNYEEVLQFHSDLSHAHQDIRAKLALQTIEAPVAGTQLVTPQESLINAIFSWYLLALHLPLLGSSMRNPSFHFSRRTCVAAAIQILNTAGIRGSIRPDVDMLRTNTTVDYAMLFLNSPGLFRGIVMQAIFAILFELVTESEERQEDTLMFLAWNSEEVRRYALACQDWIESRASNGSPDVPSCCFAAGCIAYAASIPSAQSTSAAMDKAMIDSGTKACQRYLDKLSIVSAIPSHSFGDGGPPVAPPDHADNVAAVVDFADWQMDVNLEGMDDFFAFDWTQMPDPASLPADVTFTHVPT